MPPHAAEAQRLADQMRGQGRQPEPLFPLPEHDFRNRLQADERRQTWELIWQRWRDHGALRPDPSRVEPDRLKARRAS